MNKEQLENNINNLMNVKEAFIQCQSEEKGALSSISEIQNVNAARCFYDGMYGYVMHGDNLIQYIEEDIAKAQNMMASLEASVPY